MREYFKNQPDAKKDKFKKWCKDRGADYFEDDYGVWKMPKKNNKGNIIAIRINETLDIGLGTIDESCDNFEIHDSTWFKESALWLADTLKQIFKK